MAFDGELQDQALSLWRWGEVVMWERKEFLYLGFHVVFIICSYVVFRCSDAFDWVFIGFLYGFHAVFGGCLFGVWVGLGEVVVQCCSFGSLWP